jgi:hypothetical protein
LAAKRRTSPRAAKVWSWSIFPSRRVKAEVSVTKSLTRRVPAAVPSLAQTSRPLGPERK